MGLSGAPAAGPLAPGQRWSVARKRAVVLRLIAGEPVELVSREIGVPVFKLERWRERAEAALEGALKEREADGEGPELAAALRRIGELSMEVELLRAKMGQSPGPLARKQWRCRPRLRRGAGVRGLGRAAIIVLPGPAGGAGLGPRAADRPPRAEARGPGHRPAGGDPGRPRPLALVGRGPSQGLGAAARPGRAWASRASGCCG